MAEDRRIKLVAVGHAGAQLGPVEVYESFTSKYILNDVGRATLKAGYGANDEADQRLDNLRTTDVVLEAYIKPPGQVNYRTTPVWAGHFRDPEAEQPKSVRGVRLDFEHVNGLLARPRVQPPAGGSHDEDSGNIGNMMRRMVRRQMGDLVEDTDRRMPGLYVEAEVPESGSGGGVASALVFGAGLPAWVRVNALFEWGGYLYLGTEVQPGAPQWYAGIYRSADGLTWVQVYDGTGDQVTAIHCFEAFGGQLYAGTSVGLGLANSKIVTTANGVNWALSATLADWYNLLPDYCADAGVYCLEEFNGRLYAGTRAVMQSAPVPVGQPTYIWRSADGVAWTAARDLTPVYTYWTWEKAICFSLYTWGGNLYAGHYHYSYNPYRFAFPGTFNITAWGDMERSVDGTTWAATGFSPGVWLTSGSSVKFAEVQAVLCFLEYGGKLYCGTGDHRALTYAGLRGGRIHRSDDGYSWTQVFGYPTTVEKSRGVNALLQTLDNDGNPVLWAGAGAAFLNTASVWQSASGDLDDWSLVFRPPGHGYRNTLALARFGAPIAYNYAAMGCLPRNTAQGLYWQADTGDVWRVVQEDVIVEDESAIESRWQTLLDRLQALSNTEGTDMSYFDFALVPIEMADGYYDVEFRAKSPQWGRDLHDTAVFSLSRGNMANPVRRVRRSSRPTVLYVLGPGAGEERDVIEIDDTAGLAESPYNRIEGVLDAQSLDSSTGRQLLGQAALASRGPGEEWSFDPIETADFYYPEHFAEGDIVSAVFDGQDATVKIVEVELRAPKGGKTYQVGLTVQVLAVEPLVVEPVPEPEPEPVVGLALAGADGSATIWGAADGVTWGVVQNIPAEAYVLSLARTSTCALAGTGGSAQFWRSTDGGAIWSQAGAAAGKLAVNCMAVTDSGLLAAGVDSEFWGSLDDGLLWTYVATADYPVLAMAVDGETLYAACGDMGGGGGSVWKSTDGGATWNRVLVSAKAVLCIAVADDGTVAIGVTGLLASQGYTRYSTDGGGTWSTEAATPDTEALSCMVTLADGNLLAGNYVYHLHRSTNNGQTWSLLYTFPEWDGSTYRLSQAADGAVYAAQYSGLQRSLNYGVAWSVVQESIGTAFYTVEG